MASVTLNILKPIDAVMPENVGSDERATRVSRNDRPMLSFSATEHNAVIFNAVMPRVYDVTKSMGLTIFHCCDDPTNNTRWEISVERCLDGSLDIDSDGFATARAISPFCDPTDAGRVRAFGPSMTNANMDGVQPGESFRMKIMRDSDHADDDCSDAHEVMIVHLWQIL